MFSCSVPRANPIFTFRTHWLKRWLSPQREGCSNTIANKCCGESHKTTPKRPLVICLDHYTLGKRECPDFQGLLDTKSWLRWIPRDLKCHIACVPLPVPTLESWLQPGLQLAPIWPLNGYFLGPEYIRVIPSLGPWLVGKSYHSGEGEVPASKLSPLPRSK